MKREGYSMYSKRLFISFFMFLFVAGLAVLPMHVSAASASMSLTPSTQCFMAMECDQFGGVARAVAVQPGQ
jgi:DNA phosphorothioation-dependent restriction protein DptG